MMEINFDLSQFLGAFHEIPDAVRRELRKEIKQQLTEIRKLARKKTSHRHITRTGSLNASLDMDFEDEQLTGIVGFNPDTAVVNDPKRVGQKVNYGKYVHEGHGSWAPDQFLYKSFEQREPIIVQSLEAAVERGLRAAGA